MSEHETQLAEVEIGRCHVCAQLFQTQEDLLRHLKEAHGVESLLQPPPSNLAKSGSVRTWRAQRGAGPRLPSAPTLALKAVGRS